MSTQFKGEIYVFGNKYHTLWDFGYWRNVLAFIDAIYAKHRFTLKRTKQWKLDSFSSLNCFANAEPDLTFFGAVKDCVAVIA